MTQNTDRNQITLPFDPEGKNPDNIITSERHTISPINHRDHHLVIPKYAPFYANDIRVSFKETGSGLYKGLVYGVDYYLGLKFAEASLSTAKEVFGAIILVGKERKGEIKIDQYRAVGGEWTVNTEEVLNRVLDMDKDPRVIYWDQVTDKPNKFPTGDHTFHVRDITGVKHLINALDQIKEAVGNRPANPNGIRQIPSTKNDVGLDNVNNFPIYVHSVDGDAPLGNDKYVTPIGVADILRKLLTSTDLNVGNSSKLDNKSLHQITEDFKKLTVAGADNVGGKSLEQIKDAILEEVDRNIQRLDIDNLTATIRALGLSRTNDFNLLRELILGQETVVLPTGTTTNKTFNLLTSNYFLDTIEESATYNFSRINESDLLNHFKLNDTDRPSIQNGFTFTVELNVRFRESRPNNQAVIIWPTNSFFKEWENNQWVLKPKNDSKYTTLTQNGVYYFTFVKHHNRWLVDVVVGPNK